MGAFDTIFNIGPSIVGSVLGSAYQHYRPSGSSNPTASGNLLGNINAWITADAAGKGDKPPAAGKSTWYAQLDMTQTRVGDYLVGPFGIFFVASQYIAHPMQVINCNTSVSVSRPGSASPGAGYYGGATASTLTQIAVNWPASVLQGTKGERGEGNLPGDARLPWVQITMPNFGQQILSGDWIVTSETTPRQYTVSSCELTDTGWRITASLAAV